MLPQPKTGRVRKWSNPAGIGAPDVVKATCPVWGALGGIPLSQGSMDAVLRLQLAQQAQEILGKSDLVIITERVDDVALLIGQMVKMGFVEVLDQHLPRHWKQRGISWGWTAVIWLAYILTEGD